MVNTPTVVIAEAVLSVAVNDMFYWRKIKFVMLHK